MVSREEWKVLMLWAVAIGVTAATASQSGTLVLGSVFFLCTMGSLTAVRRVQSAHIEGILLLLWLIATGAMLATVPTPLGEVLGPLYFVCMLGSLITAQRAHRTQP